MDHVRIEDLLDRALALPPEERAGFAARACGTDAALRGRLLRLLAAAESNDGFLDRPLLRVAAPLAEPAAVGAAGQRIGAFRLVRRLGAGGMGEVWLAERTQGDFTQRVALKLMLPGAGAALERFRAERQILATLDHPGIARLYDGGVMEDGRPWMAMEYVEGQELLGWCEERALGLQGRLELFLQVCEAVAYAHAHLVVHRDLKPANILVSPAGRVKLLDFGIAKLLRLDAGATATRTAHLSLAYAAPEQLGGGAITTATDVFALGVTLHQLLTGGLPWRDDPAALGTALKRMLGDAPQPASRAASGAVPARLLRGDLDAIVARALRHDPEARYADARALAEDVARHLRHEPVLARNGARVYVARRFVRRHWVSLVAASAVFAVLAAGLAGVAWQARRAEREAARATATRDFLVSVFRASDPRIAQDKPRGQVTARELLEASIGRIDHEFAADPETRIELLGVAAAIYRELGEDARRAELQHRHLALARQHYGERHPVTLGAMLAQAIDAKDRYDSPAALRSLERLDPLIREAGLDRTALRAAWWLTRGQALFADSSQAVAQLEALRTAVDLYADIAPQDPARVTALADLGTAYSNRMDFALARRYLEESIAASAQVRDRNDAELATIHGNLGLIAQNLGDFATADRAYARAEQIVRRTHGESHPHHWVPAATRARTAHLGGDRVRAGELFAALFALIPADSRHHNAVEAREWYAGCLAAEGRAAEALPLLEAAERLYRSTHLYDFQLPRVRATLADAYARVGRLEDASRLLEIALRQRLADGAPDFQPVLAVRERWGRVLLEQDELAAARAQFAEVIAQGRDRRLAHTALAHGGMARIALAQGDLDAALAASRQAVESFAHVTGFRDVRMGPYLWLIHSETLRRRGALAEARDWAERALQASRRYDHPDAPSIAQAEAAVQAAAGT